MALSQVIGVQEAAHPPANDLPVFGTTLLPRLL
jgi:hypothetical protein